MKIGEILKDYNSCKNLIGMEIEEIINIRNLKVVSEDESKLYVAMIQIM